MANADTNGAIVTCLRGRGPSRFKAYICQDLRANSGRIDAQVILLLFRSTQWIRLRYPGRIARATTEVWAVFSRLMGFEIPPECHIGPNLVLWHYFGIVIHPASEIGSHCQLRQGVTIGNRRDPTNEDVPIIGDDVEIGAYVAVLGRIRVGDGSRLGAHAVVVKPVLAGETVVGNPARVVTRSGIEGPPDA